MNPSQRRDHHDRTHDYFPPRLQGQVAVITGAARGLGRAYASRLSRLGVTSWSMMSTYTRPPTLASH